MSLAGVGLCQVAAGRSSEGLESDFMNSPSSAGVIHCVVVSLIGVALFFIIGRVYINFRKLYVFDCKSTLYEEEE